MSRAIRSVTTERGHDMGDFALFAFGGAGPLHAAELALECGIPTIIVPEEPGTMCARGILLSDIVHDLVRSAISRAVPENWPRILELFASMKSEGHGLLERDGVPLEKRSFRHFIEARYVGQNYEVRVELDDVEAAGLDGFLEAFAARHTQEYGYDIAGRPVETVNCRSQAIGQVAHARPSRNLETGALEDAVTGSRSVYFGAVNGWQDSKVYRRRSLPEGARIEGPAVIEEMSATTILLPGQMAELDTAGNIVIETGA